MAPTMDVHQLGNLLGQLGFRVVSLIDLTREEMMAAIEMFVDLLDKGVYGECHLATFNHRSSLFLVLHNACDDAEFWVSQHKPYCWDNAFSVCWFKCVSGWADKEIDKTSMTTCFSNLSHWLCSLGARNTTSSKVNPYFSVTTNVMASNCGLFYANDSIYMPSSYIYI